MNIEPGDVVVVQGVRNSAFLVVGVYLGAANTQNLIGLRCLTVDPGSANGKLIAEMFVPEELIRQGEVYRKVKYA